LPNVGRLIAIVRDESNPRLPDLARQVLEVLATQLEQLAAAVAAVETQLTAWHRCNRASQRLASIPGIGPIIATALAVTVVAPIGFASGCKSADVANTGCRAWRCRPALPPVECCRGTRPKHAVWFKPAPFTILSQQVT
jgi:hypothetical protein